MPYIRYEYSHNDSIGRDIAFRKANLAHFFDLLAMVATLACNAYYIVNLIAVLKGNYSIDFWYSLVLIFLMAVINFFLISTGKSKRDFIGIYAISILLIKAFLTAVIAAIVSIDLISNNKSGISILVGSIFLIICIVLIVIYLLRKEKGNTRTILSKKLFTNKSVVESHMRIINDTMDNQNYVRVDSYENQSNVYCHKCGTALPSDSEFCNKCGAKLG